MKSAEIIAVGTELLIGDTLNTNSQYIAQQLVSLGIAVYHHISVGDNPQRVREAMKLALSRADIVITTGGLGPTEDDLTAQMAAEVFGKAIDIHQESLDRTLQFFKEKGIDETENARAQSQIVQGAMPLFNKNGLAPGSIVEQDNKTLIILPGPPEEMKSMWQDVHAYLQEKSDQVIVSKTIHMAGIGESSAENMLKELIQSQTNPTIAPYAKSGGGVSFRITANSKTKEEAVRLIEPLKQKVYDQLKEHIFGEDDDTLELAVIHLLKEKNKTIAIAESMTGGMVVSRLIDIEGASQVIKEGLVCYSDASKVNRGLITQDQLATHTAVSELTAEQMAVNIAQSTGADIGISTTGFATIPGTGNRGMAHVALYMNGKTQVFAYSGLGNRQRIRNSCATFTIEKLRRLLA